MSTLTPLAALADLANKFAAYSYADRHCDAAVYSEAEEALEAALEATGIGNDYEVTYGYNGELVAVDIALPYGDDATTMHLPIPAKPEPGC